MTDAQQAQALVTRLESDLLALGAELEALIQRHGEAVLRVAKRSAKGSAQSADVFEQERSKVEHRRSALQAALGLARRELTVAEADQQRAQDHERANRLEELGERLLAAGLTVDHAMADLVRALDARAALVQQVAELLQPGRANDFVIRVGSKALLGQAAQAHGLGPRHLPIPYSAPQHAVKLESLRLTEVTAEVVRLRGAGPRASGEAAA